MTDELLESFDRLTDYVEEVWSSAPYTLKVPAMTVFWVGVTFGIRNISTLVRRHHNLNDIPSVFFQRRVTISVLVHKVHPPFTLLVSHKPLFLPAWRPKATASKEDIMKNTFLVRMVGCRPLGFEGKANDAERLKFIESKVLGKTVNVKLLALEPLGAAGIVRYGLLRWSTLNTALLKAGWAMFEASKQTETFSKLWMGYEEAAKVAHRGIWGTLRSNRRR